MADLSSFNGKKFTPTELEKIESEAVLANFKFKRKKLDVETLDYLESVGQRVLKRIGAPEGAFSTAVRLSEDGRSVVEVEVLEAVPASDALKLLPPTP